MPAASKLSLTAHGRRAVTLGRAIFELMQTVREYAWVGGALYRSARDRGIELIPEGRVVEHVVERDGRLCIHDPSMRCISMHISLFSYSSLRMSGQ